MNTQAALHRKRGDHRTRRVARKRTFTPLLIEEFVPAELAGVDLAELSGGDLDMQLAAHGPEGDGMIAAVGADAQALSFAEQPEPAVLPADLDDQSEDWPE